MNFSDSGYKNTLDQINTNVSNMLMPQSVNTSATD
jgi:hypothetical protein